MVEYDSSSRSRLPQEGIGSETPKPRIPRFASVRMKTGMEIQNCAYSTGIRFGSKWRRSTRHPPLPEARASRMKSELRNERASAHTTRAAAAQPRHPKSANVMMTDVSGDTFSGRSARTVISKNNHGKREEQISTGHHYPFYPATQEAGSSSDHRSQKSRDQRSRRREQQRDARAIQDSREPVAAEIIGSQPMFLGSCGIRNIPKLVCVIGSRENARQQASDADHDQERDRYGPGMLHVALVRKA